MKAHVVRCKCGGFTGSLLNPSRGTRAVCYCADCQAFAGFVGSPVTDTAGGTDIVAVAAGDFKIVKGLHQLRCVSLREGGTLRFYATCCATPIGNVPAKAPFGHLGLIHSCLSESTEEMASVFGPVRMRVSTASANSPVLPSGGPRFVASVLRFLLLRLWRRIHGEQTNPLVDKHGKPAVPLHILTAEERVRFRVRGL